MDKVLVIGLGFFGRNLARSLSEKGAEVIAVDQNKAIVEELQSKVAYAMCLDATDEQALSAVGVRDIDVGIACIGESFEANLLASVNMINLGIKQIISRGSSAIEHKILKAVGVDRIISPEREAAEQMALGLMHGPVLEAFHLPDGFICAKVPAPKGFVGKTPGELKLRQEFRVHLMVLHRPGQSATDRVERFLDPENEVLNPEDLLTLVGLEDDIYKFKKL